MEAPAARPDRHAALIGLIADRVLDHPAVAGLHAGAFGTVASHLPGRRLAGVLVDEEDGSVQVGIVARLGVALPGVAEDLRRRIRAVAGPVPVHVTIADVDRDADARDDAGGENLT